MRNRIAIRPMEASDCAGYLTPLRSKAGASQSLCIESTCAIAEREYEQPWSPR